MSSIDNIPPMPDDFWPEIIVVGKDGNIELGYAITKEGFQYVGLHTEKNINTLRQLIWQCKNNPTFHEGITEPNSNLLALCTELRPQGI